MSLYTTALSTRNWAPTANRLPDHSSLLLTADRIQRKYSTTKGLALAVAEIISASIAEAR